MVDLKAELWAGLREGRSRMLAKLDGLSEYDQRRPLTPTGTNLLGLVKHLAGEEYGYLGESLGRPPVERPTWFRAIPRTKSTCGPLRMSRLSTSLPSTARPALTQT